MAKIKDAIIDGTYHQEKVYIDPRSEPKQTYWYAEYIKNRDARSEVEDLTDEWRENQPGFPENR